MGIKRNFSKKKIHIYDGLTEQTSQMDNMYGGLGAEAQQLNDSYSHQIPIDTGSIKRLGSASTSDSDSDYGGIISMGVNTLGSIASPILTNVDNKRYADANTLDNLVYGDPNESAFSNVFRSISGRNVKDAASYLQQDRFLSSANNTSDLMKDWASTTIYNPYDTDFRANPAIGSTIGTLLGTPFINVLGKKGQRRNEVFNAQNLKGGFEGYKVGSGLLGNGAYSQYAGAAGAIVYDIADKISQGLLPNQLRKINKEIEKDTLEKNQAFSMASDRLNRQTLLNQAARYSAFGGPLYSGYYGGIGYYDGGSDGAISYDLALTDLNNKQLAANNKNSNSFLKSIPGMNTNIFSDGGNIYIKPENKGKFTAAAKSRGMGVQEFASKVLANKEDYSPLMVKRANFARNAARWNADGGSLNNDFTNGVTIIGNGGTHEENPNDGIQMGIASDGIPNLVEEGEVIYNDYVFSNRLKVPKAIRQKYKLRGETFADVFKKAQKESEERPNDPISKNSLDNIASILAQAQEELKQTKQEDKDKLNPNAYSSGGRLYEDGSELGINPLRLAEPAVNFAATMSDLFGVTNKPVVYNETPEFMRVSPNFIGNYLTYTPLDTRYSLNQLNAQAAAQRSALTQSASPSRNAAILASDYDTINSIGDLYNKAQEANIAQRRAVEEFNRGTNITNAQMALQSDQFNTAEALKYAAERARELGLTEQSSNASWGARAQNLGALATSIANIGREQDALDWRDMLLESGVYGALSQKPSNWSEARWKAYRDALTGKGYKCGGQIKTKKKGLTY